MCIRDRFLTGLWHGANWTFVVWGVYYGLILVIEKYLTGRFLEKLPEVVRMIYNMLLVMIGWVIFFSPDIASALSYLGRMFGVAAAGFIDRQALYFIKINWMLILSAAVSYTHLLE